MDPTSRGPEEHGLDGRGPDTSATPAHPNRPHRDSSPNSASRGYPTTPEFGTAAPVRTVSLTSGDYLLTVNPVDGSEIEPCPPGEQPARPQRYEADERAARRAAAAPPAPPGPARVRPPLLERQEVRERLTRLLARGRSVRLTGPAGSGRTALLDAVAEDCADLAPDEVVRLSGHRRTPAELLHELYAAVYASPGHRPDEAQLREHVHEIGAVVVLDDLEFGGAALQDFLDATPECAFLLAATPDVAAPPADSHLEEIFLGGLGRASGLKLLELATGRALSDEEEALAGDLWFESEGLPLRFMQAGALLRQRDRLLAEAGDGAEGSGGPGGPSGPSGPSGQGGPGGPGGPGSGDLAGPDADTDAASVVDAEAVVDPVALPSLAEAAAPAALLASRLSESARATLEFAVALGGEVPHQAHLPALVGDTHADAALGELAAAGLVGPTGTRYRLAAGVLTQLQAAGYADAAPARAHAAAQHYSWWAGHPSVTAERAGAESDALFAALTGLVPGTESGHLGSAVLLARTAAPALAAGLVWGAWERVLRMGQEAAGLAGEVAEEAYFRHELGILALLGDQLERARTELEASIGMRGALADKRGTVAGRRALALVSDRDGTTPPAGLPVSRSEEPASPPRGVPAALPSPGFAPDEVQTVVSRTAVEPQGEGPRKGAVLGTRRNLAAAGAGALLAAVLGTVVTLGVISDNEQPADTVKPERTTGRQDDGLPADQPEDDPSGGPAAPSAPSTSGGASDDAPSDGPTGSESADPSGSPSDDPTTTKPPSSSEPPATTRPPSSSKPPTTTKPPTSEPPETSPTPDPTDSAPSASDPASSTASGPSSTNSVSSSTEPDASGSQTWPA